MINITFLTQKRPYGVINQAHVIPLNSVPQQQENRFLSMPKQSVVIVFEH